MSVSAAGDRPRPRSPRPAPRPPNPPSARQLASELAVRRQWARAEAVLLRALRKLPCDADLRGDLRELWRSWAMNCREDRRRKQETAILGKLFRRFPTDEYARGELARPWLDLARKRMEEDRFDEAEKLLRRARRYGESPALLSNLAILHRERTDRIQFPGARRDCWSPLKKDLKSGVTLPLNDGARRFRALTRFGKFEQAFAMAERCLDRGEDVGQNFDCARLGATNFTPERLHLARSRALDLIIERRRHLPWAYFFRAFLETGEERLRRWAPIALFPARRYGWMRLAIAKTCLELEKFSEAVRHLKAALLFKPAPWQAYFMGAEAVLCLGDERQARSMIHSGLKATPPDERAGALAWMGELHLWLGLYSRAYRELNLACRTGGNRFAYCWRGAAALKLGKTRLALRRLKEAVALCPWDWEAYIWLGEALYRAGRHREALEILGKTPRGGVWAPVLRALAKGALGDAAGMRREYSELPAYFTGAVAPGPSPMGPAQIKASLEKALRQARGYRREEYSQRVWIR